MPLMKVKPTSPGRRALVKVVTPDLHKGEPHWPLVESQNRGSGRNNHGRITMRHKGGCHKHHYRIVDFRRDKDGIQATVERLDPTRTALRRRRAPLHHRPEGLSAQLVSGAEPCQARQHVAAQEHPVGTTVHRTALLGKGAIARSAGTSAQLLARRVHAALARSGESARCMSNAALPSAKSATKSWYLWSIGKVGRAGAASSRRCEARR
jgi:large subunit ribosomal protein L2